MSGRTVVEDVTLILRHEQHLVIGTTLPVERWQTRTMVEPSVAYDAVVTIGYGSTRRVLANHAERALTAAGYVVRRSSLDTGRPEGTETLAVEVARN